MTLWKLVENHQRIHGKLTFKNMRTMGNISPLLLAFVRDGSVFFALYVSITNFKGGRTIIHSFLFWLSQHIRSVFLILANLSDVALLMAGQLPHSSWYCLYLCAYRRDSFRLYNAVLLTHPLGLRLRFDLGGFLQYIRTRQGFLCCMESIFITFY
jgi:hypothetical protein